MNVEQLEALIQLQRWPEAEQAARELLSLTPGDANLLGLLGQTLIAQAKFKEAIDVIGRGLQSAPASGWLHRMRAISLQATGRLDEAVVFINEAIRLEPMVAEAFYAKATIHLRRGMRLGNGRLRVKKVDEEFRLARTAVADSLRLAPNGARGHVLRAEVELADGNPGAATSAAHRALALDPQSPAAHEILGRTAEARGDHVTAATHYVSAGRSTPDSAAITRRIRNLGAPHLALGGVSAYLVSRVLLAIARSGGSGPLIAGAVLVVVIAAVGTWSVRQTRQVRRTLPAAAQRVIELDRTTSRRAPRLRRR